jgi:Na+/phosphate symporter
MQSEYAGESVIAHQDVSAPRPPWRTFVGAATRVAYTVAGLFIFILALQLMKEGARGLKPVLEGLSADGVLNLLGFGWLGSYLVLSGSPVAAISLSLFSSGTISDTESFAMINGSRLGASFIVLLIGFVLWVTRRKSADGLYIGVVALLTAFALWIPVLPIGVLALNQGWFDSVEVNTPGAISSFVDIVYDPLVERIADNLPDLAIFVIGVLLLLAAFTVFDRALPNLEQPSQRVERLKESLHHPLAMFALGLVVTAITMSVSISLTLLIPLSLKGYIRRNAIIPYVMGANISTWVDTLLASLLLDTPRAFTIVFTEMVVGAGISLFVLIVLYKPFSAAVITAANHITHNQRNFALFMGAIFVVPLVLFLI